MLKKLTPDQIVCLAYLGSQLDGVAHNINTPLSAIVGRMELLRLRLGKISEARVLDAETELFEKCRADVAIVEQCCTKIDSVLKNTVKVSQGILSRQAIEVQLDAVLKCVLEFLNADMEFKHQTVKSFSISSQVPAVTGDPVSFTAAFLEILQNACCAMTDAAEKHLSVMLSSTGTSIEILFQDTGCGITPEEIKKIKKILHTPLSASLKSSIRETGLQRVGRLLRPYNVTFQVESRPGKTSFALLIPLQ